MKALLIEPNSFHYEVIPGFAYYFARLGYDVDVLVRAHDSLGDEFCWCPELRQRVAIRTFEGEELEAAIREMQWRTHYDVVFYTTLDYKVDGVPQSLFRNGPGVKADETKVIGCYHSTSQCRIVGDVEFAQQGRIASLSPVRTPEFEFIEVNAHHFCDGSVAHGKNSVTSFASIGVTVDKDELCKTASSVRGREKSPLSLSLVGRMNLSFMLIHNMACLKRYALKLAPHRDYDEDHYRLRKPVWIPFNVRRSVTIANNVPFSALFDIVSRSDFLVCNIAVVWDEQFATERTSGIKQLSLGFNKPCVIQRNQAEYYGFTNKNAVIYEKGQLVDALSRAVRMSSEEYDEMCHELSVLQREVERRSQDNLAQMIASLKA